MEDKTTKAATATTAAPATAGGGGLAAFCRLQRALKREQLFIRAERVAISELEEDLSDLCERNFREYVVYASACQAVSDHLAGFSPLGTCSAFLQQRSHFPRRVRDARKCFKSEEAFADSQFVLKFLYKRPHMLATCFLGNTRATRRLSVRRADSLLRIVMHGLYPASTHQEHRTAFLRQLTTHRLEVAFGKQDAPSNPFLDQSILTRALQLMASDLLDPLGQYLALTAHRLRRIVLFAPHLDPASLASLPLSAALEQPMRQLLSNAVQCILDTRDQVPSSLRAVFDQTIKAFAVRSVPPRPNLAMLFIVRLIAPACHSFSPVREKTPALTPVQRRALVVATACISCVFGYSPPCSAHLPATVISSVRETFAQEIDAFFGILPPPSSPSVPMTTAESQASEQPSPDPSADPTQHSSPTPSADPTQHSAPGKGDGNAASSSSGYSHVPSSDAAVSTPMLDRPHTVLFSNASFINFLAFVQHGLPTIMEAHKSSAQQLVRPVDRLDAHADGVLIWAGADAGSGGAQPGSTSMTPPSSSSSSSSSSTHFVLRLGEASWPPLLSPARVNAVKHTRTCDDAAVLRTARSLASLLPKLQPLQRTGTADQRKALASALVRAGAASDIEDDDDVLLRQVAVWIEQLSCEQLDLVFRSIFDDYSGRKAYIVHVCDTKQDRLQTFERLVEESERLCGARAKYEMMLMDALLRDSMTYAHRRILPGSVASFLHSAEENRSAIAIQFYSHVTDHLNSKACAWGKHLNETRTEHVACHCERYLYSLIFPHVVAQLTSNARITKYQRLLESSRESIDASHPLLQIPAAAQACAPWTAAQEHLVAIETAITPNDKLEAVCKAGQAVQVLASAAVGGSAAADDVLPIFAFIVTRATPLRVWLNAEFIAQYGGSLLESGEMAYWWVQFCSAVHVVERMLDQQQGHEDGDDGVGGKEGQEGRLETGDGGDEDEGEVDGVGEDGKIDEVNMKAAHQLEASK